MFSMFEKEELTKYHVMQISRKYKGKLINISNYSPMNFFNKDDITKLEQSIRDIIGDR
jgi:hypothetical protein